MKRKRRKTAKEDTNRIQCQPTIHKDDAVNPYRSSFSIVRRINGQSWANQFPPFAILDEEEKRNRERASRKDANIAFDKSAFSRDNGKVLISCTHARKKERKRRNSSRTFRHSSVYSFFFLFSFFSTLFPPLFSPSGVPKSSWRKHNR